MLKLLQVTLLANLFPVMSLLRNLPFLVLLLIGKYSMSNRVQC